MVGNIHSLPAPYSRRRTLLYSLLLLPVVLFGLLASTPAARAQMLDSQWYQRQAYLAARLRATSLKLPLGFPQGIKAPQPIRKVLVKFKPGVTAAGFAQRFTVPDQALLRANTINGAKATALKPLRSIDTLGWHVFQLPDPSLLKDTLAALRKHPDVIYAEPDYHLKSLIPPNDFYWGKEDLEHLIVVLAGLDTVDTARNDDSSFWTYTWSLETVNSLPAWGNYMASLNPPLSGPYPTATDRKNMLAADPSNLPLVGVIDTGVDMTHPDFSYTGNPSGGIVDTNIANGGQIQTSLARSLIGGNTNTDPLLAMDDIGHGTSVSGIIGAAPNNIIGIPGLGFPARIVPIKVIDSSGNGDDSDLLDAITYATDNHCLIVNISLNLDTTDYPQALQDAVDYAWQHGTLIVAAAGNDANPSIPLLGQTRRYPASLVHVLAVAASSYGGDTVIGGEQRASYSNYGYTLGVTAPGGDISTFVNTSPDGALYGLDPIQEYVLVWSLAPTYTVLLSDPDPGNPEGFYAAIGLYGLNYGALPGTSLAAPHVVGLAALYAAKNKIKQSTANAPQLLINAIERGCEQMNGRTDGGFDPNWGYGRIDALATLQNANPRNTTVGGLIGQVTFGGTPIHNVQVTAVQLGVANPKTYRATTAADGIFHMINMLAGNYMVTAPVFGLSKTVMATVVAGSDQHGINFLLAPPVPPGPPTNLTAVGGDQKVTLNWTAPTGAIFFYVKRSTTMGGPYTTVGTSLTNNYVDMGLTNGTKYYYVVSALNIAGESPNSSEANATPSGGIPPIPTGLTAMAGDQKVTLNWNASAGATSYNVKRATVTGGPYTTIASPTTNSYINTGLTNGTKYFFVVSAVNGSGESTNSTEVNATPSAPANSAVFVKTDTTTQGSWKGVYGVDGYSVIADTTSYPAYVTVGLSGQTLYTWANPTADVRGLQKVVGTNRIAACNYTATSMTYDLNFTDGQTHPLAAYFLDWTTSSRNQKIEFLDATTNAVLDTRTLSSFSGGVYLVWNLTGHVKLKITFVSSAGAQSAVISGLFFK